MAKLTGPLLSEAAHGKLGRILTYSKRKSSNIVRNYHIPRRETTLDQWTQRHIIGLLTAQWQCKTASEKDVYNVLAAKSGQNISGFNYFIKVAQRNLYTHHGLCGYWPMNEKTGATVTDYSGNGNHGTLKPTYPTTCPTRNASFRKSYGNALSFAGTNNAVDLGAGAKLKIFDTNAWTLSWWLKPNSTGANNQELFNILYNNLRIYIQLSTGNLWLAGKVSTVYTIFLNTYTRCFVNDNWTFFTLQASPLIYSLFINGQYIKSTAYVKMDPFNILLRIGSYDVPSSNFKGQMDEVRLYNRTLSADEILKQYNLLRLDKQRQPLLIH